VRCQGVEEGRAGKEKAQQTTSLKAANFGSGSQAHHMGRNGGPVGLSASCTPTVLGVNHRFPDKENEKGGGGRKTHRDSAGWLLEEVAEVVLKDALDVCRRQSVAVPDPTPDRNM